MIILSDKNRRVYADSTLIPWVAVVSDTEKCAPGTCCIKLDSEVMDGPMKFYAHSPEAAFDMIERYCPLLRFAFSVEFDDSTLDAVFDFGN